MAVNTSPAQANRWLFLHVPQLLLELQLSAQSPAEQAQPQALYCPQQQRLLQVNHAASQLAVGQLLPVARGICPQLWARPYQQQHEQRWLKQLAQLLYQDIAQIALYPPQGLLFEVRSLLRLYGSLAQIKQQLQSRLASMSVTGCLASGFSPLAAQLLAQARCELITENATEVHKVLGQLPLAQAGFDLKTQQRLQGLGLQTLNDLLQLPSAEVQLRLGKAVGHYLAQLRGQVATAQHYYQPPPYFYQRFDLATEVAEWPRLMFVLKRLLQSLSAFLVSRQLGTRELTLTAHHRDHSTTVVKVHFAQDVWQIDEMLSLAQLYMARQPLQQPALELSLQVRQLRPQQAQAGELLAQPKQQWSPAELVGRLQARLGAAAVYSLAATHDPRPAYAQQRTRPWAAVPTKANLAAAVPACRSQQPWRPLWLLTDPEPIDVSAFMKQWGPMRIQAAWWEHAATEVGHSRDYFIAVDADQRLAWLYVEQQRWYLHGWFG